MLRAMAIVLDTARAGKAHCVVGAVSSLCSRSHICSTGASGVAMN
jgi:hypothetical protein